MSSLRDIRRKLRSIENIKKITDAMERVAAAHLRRAQAKAEQSLPYIKHIGEILGELFSADFVHPLLEQREVKKTGLVIVSADKGLSGSYNTNVISAADHFLKNHHVDNIELIVIGRKAVEYYRRRPWKMCHQIPDWGGKITFKEVKGLTNQLMHWFLTRKFDEIWLIYTHYISVMHRKVLVEKLLNVEKPQGIHKNSVECVFEPGREEILTEILPRFCLTRIQSVLNEAYISELAARIVAMQAASKNSQHMIDDLTLVRNKTRQSEITREMIEISSGAERLT